jgi:hypothetical protein
VNTPSPALDALAMPSLSLGTIICLVLLGIIFVLLIVLYAMNKIRQFQAGQVKSLQAAVASYAYTLDKYKVLASNLASQKYATENKINEIQSTNDAGVADMLNGMLHDGQASKPD